MLPPPPSSNRTCRFPASGSPGFDRWDSLRRELASGGAQSLQAEALQTGIERLAFSDRLRAVAFGAQFGMQLVEVVRRARTVHDVLTRHAIHTGCTVVLEHQPPRRTQHIAPTDPIVQSVKSEPRLLLGL